jgi:hypothetical protein
MRRAFLFVVLASIAFSQERQRNLSPNEKDYWEAGIAAGGDYVLRAGNSGYKELIPALKKRYAESRAGDPDKQNARMALAKLEDGEQQQAMVCDVLAASQLEMQQVALNEVSYVGGWYAIRIYRELLTPAAEARFLRARGLPKRSDMTLVEPRRWALVSLPKVVPSPPLASVDAGFTAAQIQDYSQKWTAWIQHNEETLKQLQPIGEGVDFSGKTCKSNPRARSIHE